jgi:excisionase family DNA binding protein
MSEEKHCASCDCTYPANELYFNKRTAAGDGLQAYCRNCSYRRSTGQTVQRLDIGIDTPVLTAKEAAMYCRCSEKTIHRLCREGKIPFSPLSGRRTFLKYELDQWLTGWPWFADEFMQNELQKRPDKDGDKPMHLINEL